jgi:hypothetical protein
MSRSTGLQQPAFLSESIGYGFEAMGLKRPHRAFDPLLKHRAALREHLFAPAQSTFSLTTSVTLYNLTSTRLEANHALTHHFRAFLGTERTKPTDQYGAQSTYP